VKTLSLVKQELAVGKLPLELGRAKAIRVMSARVLVLAAIVLLFGVIALGVAAFSVWPLLALIVSVAVVFVTCVAYVVAQRPEILSRLSQRIANVVVVFPAAALPTITVVAGIQSVEADDRLRPYFIGLILLTAFSMARFSAHKAREEAATDVERIAVRSAIAAALAGSDQPLHRVHQADLQPLPGETERDAENHLIQMILRQAIEVCGRNGEAGGRTRAVFYSLTSGDVLSLVAWAGRSDGRQPRPEFVASNGANDRSVVEIARGEDALLVRDLDSAPPDFFRDYPGRTYKSNITVPVRCDGRSHGILTIDSDVANSLSDIDVGFMLVLSASLARGLAQIKPFFLSREDTNHEATDSVRRTRRVASRRPDRVRLEEEQNIVTTPLLSQNEFELIEGKISRNEYVGRVRSSYTSTVARHSW
jgi:hypothetical protein